MREKGWKMIIISFFRKLLRIFLVNITLFINFAMENYLFNLNY